MAQEDYSFTLLRRWASASLTWPRSTKKLRTVRNASESRPEPGWLSAALSHPGSGLDAEAFRTVRSFLVERGHVSDDEAQRLSKVKE